MNFLKKNQLAKLDQKKTLERYFLKRKAILILVIVVGLIGVAEYSYIFVLVNNHSIPKSIATNYVATHKAKSEVAIADPKSQTPITTPTPTTTLITSTSKPKTTPPVVVPSPSSSVNNLTPTPTNPPTNNNSGSSGSSGNPGSSTTGSSGSGSSSGSSGGSSSPPISYTSTNWSGYMAADASFTGISGSWAVPTTTGNGTTTTGDGTWVGIGGVTTSDLIQVGTFDSVSASGQVDNYAFYELLPQSAEIISTVNVRPGDSITASLKEIASGQWTITITNNTNLETFTDTVSYNSSLSSAEWIEEDPSFSRGKLVPLDDFGTVDFTDGSTIDNGSSVSITGSDSQGIKMVNSDDQPEATPSAIGSDGASFSITYDTTS